MTPLPRRLLALTFPARSVQELECRTLATSSTLQSSNWLTNKLATLEPARGDRFTGYHSINTASRSCRVAIVVSKNTAKPFTTYDATVQRSDVRKRLDLAILQTLVISFVMIVCNKFIDCLTK